MTPQSALGRRNWPLTTRNNFYGYKLHAICDAYYGMPLSWSLLPANAGDSPQLPPLMDQLADNHPTLLVHYDIGDRGYDALTNYQYLDRKKALVLFT